MNTDNETPDYGEPWACEPDGNGISIYARNDTVYGITEHTSFDVRYANRIVQCVNACAGMADPAAELAAMREAIEYITATLAKISDAYDSRFFRAGQWADAALAKLQPLLK